MIPIPFTDTCFLVQPAAIDEDTGDRMLGQEISTPCRLEYKSTMVRTFSGDMVVSTAKIYLPPIIVIDKNYKLKIDTKIYDLLKIEGKKDLSGKTNHYVVYI